MELSGYFLTKSGDSAIYKIHIVLCQEVQFFSERCGEEVSTYRTEVLMYVESRDRNFRGRHRLCKLFNQHRVGGVTTAAAWFGIGASFENPYMEAILICGVLRKLNTIWDTTYKQSIAGAAAYQDLTGKHGKGDKESFSTGGFLPLKDLFCLIEGTSVLTI